MPLPPFRDVNDPDEKRRELVWIAISFIVILASWLAVVLIFGYRPLIMGMTYDEVVLSSGLVLLMFCTLVYLTAREREQRGANRALLAQLSGAVASLDERVEQLDGLCLTSAELVGSLDIGHICHSVAEAAVELLRADRGYVALFDRESGRPVCLVSSPPAAGLGSLAALDEELPLDPSGAHLAPNAAIEQWNETRTTIRAPIPLGGKAESTSSADDSLASGQPMAAALSGVLVAKRRPGRSQFTQGEMRVLTTLANMTAKAIESAQLHAGLRESYLATVRSLVNSLQARDNYTASHSARVAALALRMAEHLGLPESMTREIEVFGPLHDVGKIGIPDEILMKPRPLSERERQVCREHCMIGERILRPLRPSKEALGMVRSHHESWDGSGYPDGLAGESIPVLARLLQVADTYDAMTTERPYQGALSEQEVLSHFRQYAGILYDPDAVKALCAVVNGAPGPLGPGPAGAELGTETGGLRSPARQDELQPAR